MKKLFILLLVFLGLFLNSLFLNAESRVALVIGNNNYTTFNKLSSPINDATDVAKALEKLDFNVISLFDGNRDQMFKKINSFRDLIKNCDVALFYYSGHGVQSNGDNYLIPLGENFENEDDFESKAVSMSNVLNKMNGAKNKIVILDACRNNPFPKNFYKSLDESKGLAAIKTTTDNTLIMYATGENKVALDGKGRNSPFTKIFLKHIGKNEHIVDIAIDIAGDVETETKGEQIPWTSVGITKKIYLAGRPGTPSPITDNTTTKVETPNNVVNNTTKNETPNNIVNNTTTKVETPTNEYKDSDLIITEQNGKYGIVNKKGEVIIPFKYDFISSIGEGLIAVKLKKWGFIDKTDEVVIPFRYDDMISPFRKGVVPVKLNGKWGFIDKTDREVIPIKYDKVYTFESGRARVKLNDREFYIDKNGNEVK